MVVPRYTLTCDINSLCSPSTTPSSMMQYGPTVHDCGTTALAWTMAVGWMGIELGLRSWFLVPRYLARWNFHCSFRSFHGLFSILKYGGTIFEKLETRDQKRYLPIHHNARND